MSENTHAKRIAAQLAMADDDDEISFEEEHRVVEADVTIHLCNEGLHMWIADDSVEDDLVDEIGYHSIEEIERTLFNRFPKVLLDNAEKNLIPEHRRYDDAPRVGKVEYYPDLKRIGGVTVSMDQHAQWAMIPLKDGGRVDE